MNAKPSIAILSLSLLGLAACSSANTKSAYVAPERVGHTTYTQVRDVTDAEYVATVDWIARHRGVRVRWVNPPVNRVEIKR